VLWPLAILTIIHRVVVKAVNGSVTNDFGTVYAATRRFLDGGPVYVENLLVSDPHYLYSPSATVLLSPFGMIDMYTYARWTFIAFNFLCIVGAVLLLLRLFKIPLTSYATPAVFLGVFLTESVTNTLVFTNINGLIFLCQAAFFVLLHERRLWLSGIPLGLSLAIKPMLAPLLVLPLLRRQWQPFVISIAIPLVTFTWGWWATADGKSYFDVIGPYMSEVRDYYNSSIAGIGAYFDAPEPLVLAARVVVIALTLATVWLLMGYRHNHEVLWMTTTAGVVMAGVFLVSTLGQMYYSMLLIPLLLTVVLEGSFVRNAFAWIAAYGFFTMDGWESSRWPSLGRVAEYMHPTIGWLLMLLTVFVIAVWRYTDPRRHDRITPSAVPPSRAGIGTTAGQSASVQ